MFFLMVYSKEVNPVSRSHEKLLAVGGRHDMLMELAWDKTHMARNLYLVTTRNHSKPFYFVLARGSRFDREWITVAEKCLPLHQLFCCAALSLFFCHCCPEKEK